MKFNNNVWGGNPNPTAQDFIKGKKIIGVSPNPSEMDIAIYTIDTVEIDREGTVHIYSKDCSWRNLITHNGYGRCEIFFLESELDKAKDFLRKNIKDNKADTVVYNYFEKGNKVTDRHDPTHSFRPRNIKRLRLDENGEFKIQSLTDYYSLKEEKTVIDTREDWSELDSIIDNIKLIEPKVEEEPIEEPKIEEVKKTSTIDKILLALGIKKCGN